MVMAYVDAGIWVAYGLGNIDRKYPRASEVVKDIVRGKYRGVVSLLSLLETMDVIRKRVVQNTPKEELDSKSGQDERGQFISQKSQNKYRLLIDKITQAVEMRQMLLVDFKGIDIGRIFSSCNDFLTPYFGKVLSFDRCFACNGEYVHYEYKGLGPIDTMHIFLAREIGCSYFFTTDKGFRDLSQDPQFSSIRIEIL